MLKFLFGKKNGTVKVETQRESFARVMEELNGLIAAQGEAPKIVIDPANGGIELVLPQQLADEALALPAPKAEDDVADQPSEDASAKDTSEKKDAA